MRHGRGHRANRAQPRKVCKFDLHLCQAQRIGLLFGHVANIACEESLPVYFSFANFKLDRDRAAIGEFCFNNATNTDDLFLAG